jgi:hypothetical protein
MDDFNDFIDDVFGPDGQRPLTTELDFTETEALVQLILYLYDEEKQDQQECGCEDHMFFNVDKLKDALQHSGIDMEKELKIYREALDDEQEEE